MNLDKTDFGITRLFNNNRIPSEVKTQILIRLYETDLFVKKYGLTSYYAGLSTFRDIKSKIPASAQLYGREYKKEELEKRLSNIEIINDRAKIKQKIAKKIDNLLDQNNYDSTTGIFKFINAEQEKERIEHVFESAEVDKSALNQYSDFLPKVWINALALLALIKWQIYSKCKGKKVATAIRNLIQWLNNNRDVYDDDNNIYYGWNEYYRGVSPIIKLFESCLALQTLLRAKKLNYKDELKAPNIGNFIKTLTSEFQDKTPGNEGRWPSEVIFEKTQTDKPIIKDLRYDGDIGATSSAIQLLVDYIINVKPEQSEYIRESLDKACNWLINNKQETNGCWKKSGTESVDYTAQAIQALLKCGEILDNSRIYESIEKGVNWIGDQFCVRSDNDNISFAWPKDGEFSSPCVKNTSLAVSTLIKANISNESFIIRKAILWLLDFDPSFGFDNVYIYCAILEYLKSLDDVCQVDKASAQ